MESGRVMVSDLVSSDIIALKEVHFMTSLTKHAISITSAIVGVIIYGNCWCKKQISMQAKERERNRLPPHARRWPPDDVPTMKAFLGLTFLMEVMKPPHRNDYWWTGKSVLHCLWSGNAKRLLQSYLALSASP